MSLLVSEIGRMGGGNFPGDVAFTLHDTYGFPVEVTREVLVERGISLDEAGFEAAMEAQRDRAREAMQGYERVVAAFRDREIRSRFVGYEREQVETQDSRDRTRPRRRGGGVRRAGREPVLRDGRWAGGRRGLGLLGRRAARGLRRDPSRRLPGPEGQGRAGLVRGRGRRNGLHKPGAAPADRGKPHGHAHPALGPEGRSRAGCRAGGQLRRAGSVAVRLPLRGEGDGGGDPARTGGLAAEDHREPARPVLHDHARRRRATSAR